MDCRRTVVLSVVFSRVIFPSRLLKGLFETRCTPFLPTGVRVTSAPLELTERHHDCVRCMIRGLIGVVPADNKTNVYSVRCVLWLASVLQQLQYGVGVGANSYVLVYWYVGIGTTYHTRPYM